MPDSAARGLRLSRRELLRAAGAAAAAWQLRPWRVTAPAAFAQVPPGDPVLVPTLEAFADTLIPGAKRSPVDRAIAGAAPGGGAVQAGALALMNFPPAGIAPALPGLAAAINARAVAYAAGHAILLDPTVPPFVALDFAQRTDLLVLLLDGSDPDQIAYFALSAIVLLAYHTAAHLHTAEAIQAGHPGLTAIGFPPPQPDGLWRFPQSSYGRTLALRHPRTTSRGSPR